MRERVLSPHRPLILRRIRHDRQRLAGIDDAAQHGPAGPRLLLLLDDAALVERGAFDHDGLEAAKTGLGLHVSRLASLFRCERKRWRGRAVRRAQRFTRSRLGSRARGAVAWAEWPMTSPLRV